MEPFKRLATMNIRARSISSTYRRQWSDSPQSDLSYAHSSDELVL